MSQSKWARIIITWVLIIAITIIGIELINLAVKHYNNNHNNTHPQTTQKPPQNNKPPSIVWGVDTASTINPSFYQCVTKNYGNPVFVGRYLGNNGDASKGLTKEEVKFLHDKKLKILPIHNHLKSGKGVKDGQSEALEAIKLAKAIGVKNGVVIVVDIEPKYPVDADFLIGWTKTILDNKFIPGVYGNLENDDLKTVYVEAAKKDSVVKEKMILWTNQPSLKTTTRNQAPKEFKGKTPNTEKTLVWQYAIDGKQCNIDTDLAKGNLLDLLW